MTKSEKAHKYVTKGLSVKDACTKVGLKGVSTYYTWVKKSKGARTGAKKVEGKATTVYVIPKSKGISEEVAKLKLQVLTKMLETLETMQ